VTPTLLSAIDGFAGLDVLVVGDAMLDAYILGSSGRLCQEAPVPIVAVDQRTVMPGGAANVAMNVRALGARPRLVSVVGEDDDGRTLRSSLRDAAIDDDLLRSEARRTTLSKSRVVGDGQLLVRVDDGTITAVDGDAEEAVIASVRAAWSSCGAVILSDYSYGVLTPALLEAVRDLQRTRPVVVVVDAKDLARYRPLEPTAVKPNHGQAATLLGEPPATAVDRERQVEAGADRLFAATGAQIVAVTLDTEGAIALERRREAYRTYAKPRRAVSTSGAGDTFAAALALALATGATTPTAAELASAAAAVVVGKERTAVCDAGELREQVAGGGKLVHDLDDLAARVELHRRQGRRIVFTNGCFDILHRGHVTYLSRAKALGDVLVVAVNDDDSVRALKGPERPVTPLEDREQVLAALSCVDLVVPFGERTPERPIEAARPDVVVKGGDYTIEMLPEAALVERLGGRVQILPYVDDRSTTGIIERIRAADRAGAA
jgi:D-beta-D-heptose 7-phosphate kinase/D-beta-D-heptose 1-phosphate adenosyltransferase